MNSENMLNIYENLLNPIIKSLYFLQKSQENSLSVIYILAYHYECNIRIKIYYNKKCYSYFYDYAGKLSGKILSYKTKLLDNYNLTLSDNSEKTLQNINADLMQIFNLSFDKNINKLTNKIINCDEYLFCYYIKI
jgi:hypothetical protein